MSALKSLIITLPAKGLAAAIPKVSSTDLDKAAPRLGFTTSILMDKITLEGGAKKLQAAKHMEVGLPVSIDADGFVFSQEDTPARGKKRRLDHLTWEEKLQRKKLKNRVAAQTSRDRKKAKLDELEETVRILRERNERLQEECSNLRTENESLIMETKKLKQDRQFVETKESKEQLCSMCQSRVDCIEPALGSAVSPTNPLQQGGAVQTARPLTLTPSTTILLKILTLYLLSKTYLVNSKETNTWSDSKNWQKVFCEKLPLRWKQTLLHQMNRSPSKQRQPKNVAIQRKWWGRHQVMWKPMQPMKA